MKIKLNSCRMSYNWHLFSIRKLDFWLVLVRITANYEGRGKNVYSVNVVYYDENGRRKTLIGNI